MSGNLRVSFHPDMLRWIATRIDLINRWTGLTVSWFALILVLLMVVEVLLRYLFNISSAWTAELEWHLFSLVFLLGAGWALQEDRHVRVDVFYQRFSERTKRWIDLFGHVLLLTPFCFVGIIESLGFVKSAYLFQETSADPGGLPYRFLIKSAIPIGFLLLGLQSISLALKNLIFLKNG